MGSSVSKSIAKKRGSSADSTEDDITTYDLQLLDVVDWLVEEHVQGNDVTFHIADCDSKLQKAFYQFDNGTLSIDLNRRGSVSTSTSESRKPHADKEMKLRKEIHKIITDLAPAQQTHIEARMRQVALQKRTRLVKRVYECLDPSNTGTIPRGDLIFWASNPRSWKEEADPKLRAQVVKAIEQMPENVTKPSFKTAFSQWTPSQLHMFDIDPMYYERLAFYGKNPTESGRQKLRDIPRWKNNQHSRGLSLAQMILMKRHKKLH